MNKDDDCPITNCSFIPASDVCTTISQTNFNVLPVNVRSMNAHHEDLVTFLATLPLPFVDILAVQETWSVNASFPLPGYQNFVFKSRDMNSRMNTNCGGGVGLYVRNGLEFEILEDLSIFEKGLHESIWILIKLPKQKSLIIGNSYRPNTYPLANQERALTIHLNILDKIRYNRKLNKAKLILTSDFNLDISNLSNINSSNYLNSHFARGLHPMITISAHHTATSQKVIDHIFSSAPSPQAKSGVIQVVISDHMPTIFSDPTILHGIRDKLPSKPLINKVTIEYYLKLLSTMSFSTSTDPELAFNSFFDQLKAAGSLAFPTTEVKAPKNKNRHKPWMTPSLLSSNKIKNILFSKKLKSPTASNISQFQLYNKVLKKCLRHAKKLFYIEAFDSARTNLKTTWNLINEVSGRSKPSIPLGKTFVINGHLNSNQSDVAEGFNKFFSSIGPSLADKIPEITKPLKTSWASPQTVSSH